MLTVCLLTLFMAHPTPSFSVDPYADDTAPATGPAGCAIQVGDRVLMVRDIWSHRWGLPGGGHDPGETARQTAERETFEETGLRVVAGPLLWTSPSHFSVFRCSPTDAEITAHANGALVLPKEGYEELLEAHLMNLHDVPESKLRYPSQRAPLLTAMGPIGLPEDVLRAPPPGDPLFADELPYIVGLQAGVAKIFGPYGDRVMGALSQLGSTMGIMLAIAGVWFLVGWRAGVEMAYALLLTCLLGIIAKQAFGWPRPFHLDPTLQRAGASSFGFPSAHTVRAAILWGLVAQRVPWRGRWWVCTALVLACAVSRVALGVHFFHDVVAGGLLGAGACWAYHAHRTYHACTQVALRTWRLSTLGLGTAALLFHPQPATIAICSLLLGFTVGGWALQRRDGALGAQPMHWTLHPRAGRRLLAAAVANILGFAILRWVPLLVPFESSFLPLLYVHVLQYTALGGLLAAADAAADILQPPRACASHVA